MMNFFEKIRQFMYGRYGMDELNKALLAAALILLVLSSILRLFFKFPWIILLAYIAIGFFLFRTLSKNTYQREKENIFFTTHFAKAKKKFAKYNMMFKDKNHRYFSCPTCKATMRVPKGKGKIQIRCKNCGQTFIKKT